jgi:hypothetical protein
VKIKKLKKRTRHYIQDPQEYEIECTKCGGHNLEWSEYEGLIWCQDCRDDVKGTEGVFGGPISIEVATMLGMSFDKWDMTNKCLLRYDIKEQKYIPTKKRGQNEK